MVFSISGRIEDFPILIEEFTPPYHLNCRCTLCPIILKFKTDKEISEMKKRNKAYDPYKDIRDTKEQKRYIELQDEKLRQYEEKKAYAEMVAVLGKDAPVSLGAYRRMRRQNTTNYQELMYQMREQ